MATAGETPEEHLLRSLQVTATSRFIGAKRLRSHEAWSLWAISFASLLLIFVPLFQPFGMKVYLSDSVINLAQILAASIILVFSLLVNGSKFGLRAELMHGCALSINSISRRLEESIQQGTTPYDLPKLRKEYEIVLEKHENHSDLDFMFAKIRRFSKFYNITWKQKSVALIRYWFSYTHYVAILIAEFIFIFMMLVNPSDISIINHLGGCLR